MSGWSGVLKEIQETQTQIDYVRRKYVKQLSDLTGRNTITYYSGWLNKRTTNNTDINDSEIVNNT